MSERKKSFVNGAVILGVAGLLCKIIGAFFRIPLRNMMGVAGMTYYSTVYPFYSTLLVVSTTGIPTAISKMVSERVTLGDCDGAKAVFRKSFILLAFIGVITTCLMFFGADILARATNCPGSEKSFRALAPALFFVSIMCSYRGYLQGLQRMTGTAASQVTEQVGKLVISLILAKRFLPYGFDVAAMGALLGITISEFLALLVIIVFYLKNRKLYSAMGIDAGTAAERFDNRHILGQVFTIAIPVTIGASIMPMTGIVDTLLIKNIMLGTGFTRQYADMCFAVFRTDVSTVINMPGVLTVALSMSLVPAISEACAHRDESRVRLVSTMGIKLALIVGLPCAVGLYVIGGNVIDFLFRVQPEELEIGSALMRISSVGIVFLSLAQTITGCIQGYGKPVVPVVNLAAGAALKVIVMSVLMRNPAINIMGAAWSTVCCYAVAGILDMIYLIRKVGLRLNLWDVFCKPLCAAATMGIAVHFIKKYCLFIHSNVLLTILSVLVGILVYGLMCVVLKMFNAEELELIPGGTRLRKYLIR